MPQTIPGVVGEYLARFRDENHLTQESIALESRAFGTTWGASKIRRIEDGDALLTLPDLIVLMEAMRLAARLPVTFKHIFPDDSNLEIGGVPLSGSELRGILRGDTNAWLEPKRIGFGLSVLLDGKPAPASLATRRAAKRLGISPQELDALSFNRWMETFDQIVVSYSDGDSPQARGHATRRVLLELSDVVSESDPDVGGENDDAFTDAIPFIAPSEFDRDTRKAAFEDQDATQDDDDDEDPSR